MPNFIQKLSNKLVIASVTAIVLSAGAVYALQPSPSKHVANLQVKNASATQSTPVATPPLTQTNSPDAAPDYTPTSTASQPNTTETTTQSTPTNQPTVTLAQPAPVTLVSTNVCSDMSGDVFTVQTYSDGSTNVASGGPKLDEYPQCPNNQAPVSQPAGN